MNAAVGAGADFQQMLILQAQAGKTADDGGEEAFLHPKTFGDPGQQILPDGAARLLLHLRQQIAQGVLIPRRTLAAVIFHGFIQIPAHVVTSRMCSAAQAL